MSQRLLQNGEKIMKKWNLSEIFMAVMYNIILIFLLPFSVKITIMGTMHKLALYVLVLLVISAVYVYILKTRDKRINIALGILTVCFFLSFVTLLLFGYMNVPIYGFNTESLIFGALFAFLHCAGLFFGSLIGYLIWFLLNQKRK